jgi:hypothetical protein
MTSRTLARVTPAPETLEPAPETLDFIFDFVRGAPERQLVAAEALDSKLFQLFAVGGVVIGLAATGNGNGGLLAAAGAAYVALAISALYGLWIRQLRVSRHPDQLWNEFWQESVTDIKHAIIDDVSSGYAENRRHLAAKRWALRFALVAIAAEVIFVASALIAA